MIALVASAVLALQNPPSLGIRTSVFGTYVQPHQLIVFPFVAHTWDRNFEYAPSAFGGVGPEDMRGRYRSNEAQLFVAYGVTDWLALEIEGSRISATFEKSPSDVSGTPARINESGFADIAGQLRFRLNPGFFASIELLPPSHKRKVLIGDAQWNVKGEIGLMRGFRWGMMTFRTTVEYNRGDTHPDLGETSLEYLRQMSRAFRLFLAIEGGEGGAPDDWTFVSGGRWRLTDGLFLKFDNALGLLSKSTDWESQLGIVLQTH